jgi:hypothetical protein
MTGLLFIPIDILLLSKLKKRIVLNINYYKNEKRKINKTM